MKLLSILLVLTATSILLTVEAFAPSSSSKVTFFSFSNGQKTVPKNNKNQHHLPTPPTPCGGASSSSTQLHVFDFFKKRATEGVDQLKNLSEKTAKGKILEGLTDAATYTSTTNAAFATGLAKSRNRLLYNLDDLFNGGGDILEELEDILLQADLGTKTSMDVMEEIRSLREDSTDIFSRDDLRSVLRGKLIEALQVSGMKSSKSGSSTTSSTSNDAGDDANDMIEENPQAIRFSQENNVPTVLFVMGANGMGKTTTIGKLASRLRNEGNQTVLLAACDTFRAGAVEQLEMWADRAGVDCYTPNEQQKTPSAVLYGALDMTMREKYNVLIVDTSGRLSNNEALTEELAKMKRVIQKRFSVAVGGQDGENGEKQSVLNTNVPHETLLVIDAAQGRMALDSARVWNREIGLTGLVLTKLDGSAKGGSVVAVSRELGLPVKLIGVGEKIEDLRDFDPEAFVDGLLGIGAAGGSSDKNEGKALARRLDQMRTARDQRAKEKKLEEEKAKKKVPMVDSMMDLSGMTNDLETDMDIDLDETLVPSGGGSRANPANKVKNKMKKKKKRKGKR
jgi:Signal recognition particle GTPase